MLCRGDRGQLKHFSHTCSLRRACILLTIYLYLIPQPHMLSKRMTAFRVLIVTYFDAIEEFMQPGNCYKCPHYGGKL